MQPQESWWTPQLLIIWCNSYWVNLGHASSLTRKIERSDGKVGRPPLPPSHDVLLDKIIFSPWRDDWEEGEESEYLPRFSVLVMNVSKVICALMPIFSNGNSIQDMLVKLCDFPNNYEITFWFIHIFWSTGVLSFVWKTCSKGCFTQIWYILSFLFLFYDDFIPNFLHFGGT